MKSIQIRSYFGPYFPVFGLNTKTVTMTFTITIWTEYEYYVNLCIHFEYRKIRTRNNSIFEQFSRSVVWASAGSLGRICNPNFYFLMWFYTSFLLITACKVSKYRVFSGPYFPVFGVNILIEIIQWKLHSMLALQRTADRVKFWLVTVACNWLLVSWQESFQTKHLSRKQSF